MKRLFSILSFALLLTSIQLYGQTDISQNPMPGAGETYFGIKGGLNVSKILNSSKNVNSSWISGMHAGVYFGYVIADDFSIQPELLYSRQGGKGEVLRGKGEVLLRRDYINLPVMLHYMLPVSMLSGFYLELGPQVGFVVNTQGRDLQGNKLPSDDLKSIKDNTKKFDFALAGGLGYHFNRNWNANVRYTHGFINTLKKADDNQKQTNSVLQIGLGYTF